MTAQIIQFTPKPNPKRDQQRMIEAIYDMTWRPFFTVWGFESTDQELVLRGLAIDTDSSEPPDDCA